MVRNGEKILSDKVGNVRRSGDGRWDETVGAAGGLLVGRFLCLSADRVIGGWDCVSRSGSVPPAGSILHAACPDVTGAKRTKQVCDPGTGNESERARAINTPGWRMGLLPQQKMLCKKGNIPRSRVDPGVT